MYIPPPLPLVEVPVLNTTLPLTPPIDGDVEGAAPAVASTKPPLLVSEPEPDVIVTEPPEVPNAPVAEPAAIDTVPP